MSTRIDIEYDLPSCALAPAPWRTRSTDTGGARRVGRRRARAADGVVRRDDVRDFPGEDARTQCNFVEEFKRRLQQRRWAALISNTLPPAVLTLHQTSNSMARMGDGNYADDDDEDDDTPPTQAWELPHTCIFQSDIVGFTSLTQRSAPHQLVAMLHSMFAAYDGLCAEHRVQKIETIGDAHLAATGCTAAPTG